MSIISACLPLLHPYFKRHSPEAVVAANRRVYDLVHAPTEDMYDDPRGLSMYMGKVQNYHENVIE